MSTKAERSLPWMKIAVGELGQKEVPGSRDNPRIVEYHKSTTLTGANTRDAVPWCSSFVNWVFEKASMKSTNSAWAASWLNWGVKLKTPKYGAVAILRRPGGNHVCFFVRDEKRKGMRGFVALGGNQSDQVCYSWYSYSKVRGYRWPSDAEIIDADAPKIDQIDSSGKMS